jgi:DNA helicase-4
MDNNYLDTIYKDIKLDNNQKEAVVCNASNEMIIAGAGSGKTTTMAAKVKYLVEKEHVNPKNILVISFTNKAVSELQERINKEFNLPVDVLTFHKLGLRIIGHSSHIIMDNERYKVISAYLNNLDLTKLVVYFNDYFNIPVFIKFLGLANLYKRIKKVDYKPFIDLLFSDTNSIILNKKGIFFARLKDNILEYYKKYKYDNKLIDFNDMINLATQKVDHKIWEYIIVDEYQDISKERYELLKKISIDAHLIVVGDDWQAIYAFAGSDVNIFREFLKRDSVKVIKIVNTYRNSQELINLAGNFIMQNAIHIKKELISNKHLNKPIKILYIDEYTQIKVLEKVLSKFKTEKILILGRYNFDIKPYLDKHHFLLVDDKLKSIRYPYLDITYLTVHASKGLGFDEVVIINMYDGIYGFPSHKDNPKFLNIKSDILEERRLFYVAITRTKNYVYLLVPYQNQSSYIKEIIHNENVEIIKED